MVKDGATRKRTVTRKCPVCGHESWRIIYGMVMPDAREQYTKAEFAGCVVLTEERYYPRTGKTELGVPKWACQNAGCGHHWW